MNNIIFYFYGIQPEKIKNLETGYHIYFENKEYIFKETKRSVEELYELSGLSNDFSFLHKIVLNKFGSFLSTLNNKNYILMLLNCKNNRKINVNDIRKMTSVGINKIYKYILRDDWRTLWINEIEYIENKCADFENEQRKYLDYNIGLAENAIQLLLTAQNDMLTLCHSKFDKNMRLIEFLDPTNIVLDTKVRDFCEYYREVIDLDSDEIKNIDFNDFDGNQKKLFFTRYMYDKNYFERFDRENMTALFKKFHTREQAIRILYNELKDVLPEIEWIKKAS